MIKKYYKNIFKLIGLLFGIIVVSYAWFYNKEDSDFDNIAVRTNTANEILRQLNTSKKDLDTIKEFGGLETNIHINDFKPIFMRVEKKDE